jgi:hypothetical protein
MGSTSIRRQARRVGLVLAAAVCVCALGATTAQAQAPLSWSGPVGSDATAPGALGITAVNCPSVSLCVAVDDAGNVLSSTSPASGAWGTPGSINTAHSPHLSAVSCPSSTLCVATDKAGNAYASATPATAPWTTGTPGDVDGANQLNGVSCPSSSLCVAVDNAGDILASTTPGTLTAGSWPPMHVDGSNHINAISCPSATLCAAVDDHGKIYASTTPTISASWQFTTLTGGAALTALSCNASGLCVAVAINGSVYATADAASPTPTWSATLIDAPGAPLSGVSCTDNGLCVLVDHSGNALESDNPAGGQPAWTQTTIDSGHALTGLSCLSAGLCVATDNHGDTLAATLPAPAVTTGSGSASSQTTATLNATVNPNDATLADCHFDYGPTAAYGSSAPCTVVPSATGGAQAVTATLSGLNASTAYHFRIVASSGVASAGGADASFTTPAPLKPSPAISGTPAVGSTLTCKPNVTVPAALTVSYQWTRDTVAISGAASPTYVIVIADQTHHLACQVTIAGDGGSASATSGFDGVPAQSGATITESFVGTDKRGANSVSAPVHCSPQAVGGCTIKLQLVGIKTAHHVSQRVPVGSMTAKLAAGATKTLTVSLNATGRRLLKKLHSLAVTLTVSGTVIGTLNATLQTDKLVFTQKGKHIATRHTR